MDKLQKNQHEEKWTISIIPSAPVFNINLGELYHYRDLLLLFVKRDFASKYKQTVLGPIWHLVQPILQTILFLVMFNGIAKVVVPNGVPGAVFQLSGIVIWNYFSSCFISTSSTFITNANIFGKVYFPRLIMPLSIVASNLVQFVIQFALLISVMIFYNFKGFPILFNVSWFLLPIVLLLMAFMSLGLGIIISALTTKYRDLNVLTSFGVQLLMFVTPVGYDLSQLEHSSFFRLIKWNPLSPIIQTFRDIILNQPIDWAYLSFGFGFTVVFLLIGILLFSKVEKTFMDTI